MRFDGGAVTSGEAARNTAPSLFPFFGTRLRRKNFNLAKTQYRTQFFVLDKAKALPIRIGSQTAWDAVRLDFIDNKEKRLALRLHFGMIPVISGFLNAC